MKSSRRHFPATEKVAILKRHLVEKTPVSDLCNELVISALAPWNIGYSEEEQSTGSCFRATPAEHRSRRRRTLA